MNKRMGAFCCVIIEVIETTNEEPFLTGVFVEFVEHHGGELLDVAGLEETERLSSDNIRSAFALSLSCAGGD